jgi:hypothetical protein
MNDDQADMHYTIGEDKKCCNCIKLGLFFKILPVFYFPFILVDMLIYFGACFLLLLLVTQNRIEIYETFIFA